MSTLQEMADRLAEDAIAAGDELGDDRFYDQVSRVLLAASPTFNEVFMTAIRVRLAERRGREFLARALAIGRGEVVEVAASGPTALPESGH